MPERTRPTIVPTPSARSARQRGEQPTRGLGVAGQQRQGGLDGRVERRVRVGRLAIAARAARDASLANELERVREQRKRGAVELDLQPRGRGELARVPDEAESRDVRHRVGAARAQGVRGVPVQRCHRRDCRGDRLVRRASGLEGVGDHAGSERLREHEDVAVAGAAISPDGIHLHGAGHGQTVDRLGRDDRVAAEDRDAGGGCRVLAAAQDRRHGIA